MDDEENIDMEELLRQVEAVHEPSAHFMNRIGTTQGLKTDEATGQVQPERMVTMNNARQKQRMKQHTIMSRSDALVAESVMTLRDNEETQQIQNTKPHFSYAVVSVGLARAENRQRRACNVGVGVGAHRFRGPCGFR